MTAPIGAQPTAARSGENPASAADAAGTTADLDARYGRRRQRGFDRRLGWVVAGAALLLGLIVLVFGGWQSGSALEYRDLSYSVDSERTVTANFEVTVPPGTPVACAIEALSTSYATVGWRVTELPISDQRTRRFSETLITTYPSTTATLRSCWVLT